MCNLSNTFGDGNRANQGKIDSINNEGVLVSIPEALSQQNGKIIQLLIKCRNMKMVKTAIIRWSNEWGFGARFIYSNCYKYVPK